MIIHRLIRHHLRYGDDDRFYALQAEDAVRWMKASGVRMGSDVQVLDLGCGHGTFGAALMREGCEVTFSDTHPSLRPDLAGVTFRLFEVGKSRLAELGQYDLVLFSNVFEHLPEPGKFLDEVPDLLRPGGRLFLSWTNWLSPWGGHDFSPLHYLGPRWGPKLFDWWKPGKRQHFPYAGLWPTYIGRTLAEMGRRRELRVLKVAPRYYTELAWIMRIPVVREFLAWNCAMLIERVG